MNIPRFTFNFLTVAFLTIFAASLAQAQATRTWVSGVGDDANPCSRTAPCKTFAGAISKTAAGGEISVLDPGGYGAVTITKSITINGTGTLASILAAGTNGIVINAASTDVVILRNLDLNGAGTGLDGIRYLSAKEVHVENCVISGFTGDGIDVALGSTQGELYVDNVHINRITGASSAGIRLTGTSALAIAQIDRSHINRVANGLLALNNSRATISDSDVAACSIGSIIADSAAGSAEINVRGCRLTYSAIGIRSGSVANTIVRVSQTLISGGGTGLSSTGGSIISFGTNEINGNATNGSPTSTVPRT
jgi:hypothetical protein